MKSKLIVPAVLLTLSAALPFGVHAASDGDKPSAEAPSDKTAKKVKPHSHAEEKTGVPQKAPEMAKEERSDKAKPTKDKHYHPQDGK
ncbi:MAG TPA: hypothetical protein VJ001_14035 [Rhodocyclaceae bacterium]|nr:hypothetical protein [Rhodocyclaceae bacterium]